MDSFDAAIPGLQVHDALKRISETNLLEETVDRRNIVRAQTPQGFKYREISRAHNLAQEKLFNDDSEIAEKAGLSVSIVDGDPKNLKITTAEDLIHGSYILGKNVMSFRTGIGFDVHKFGPGDHVVLGGVRIDHDHALIGHSDADVLLHAITDAILGSIAAGDIGTHFPDTDPQWKNVESSIFLKTAGERLSELGGKIIHIDANIICERPKINPYRKAIAANISNVLGVNPDCVSIKATTTEQLGFIGAIRGNRIASNRICKLAAEPRARDIVIRMSLYFVLATWFGVGKFRYAPGSIGSLTALPLAWWLSNSFGSQTLLSVSVILFIIGVWASENYANNIGQSDPSSVVIDEVAGQLFTLSFVTVDLGL